MGRCTSEERNDPAIGMTAEICTQQSKIHLNSEFFFVVMSLGLGCIRK